jgi:tripartite-type tricarboxylate transporter receptor subunit TctC
MRRSLLGLACVLFAGAALAQSFPSRPIRIVVPLAAGGTGDTVARLLGEELATALAGPVIIENRPGSGGVIGTDAVAKSAPDGHTLLHTSPSHVLNAALRPSLPYHPLKDFASIARVAETYQVLVAHPSLPANTVQELILLAKKQRVYYGSAGNGSATHLNMELLRSLAGIDVVHVPYKGSTQARTDVISGQIQLAVDGLLPTLPQIRAGKLKALAVTNSRRASATRAALSSPALREKFVHQGAEPAGGTAEQLDELMRAELARWSKVVAEANVKVD